MKGFHKCFGINFDIVFIFSYAKYTLVNLQKNVELLGKIILTMIRGKKCDFVKSCDYKMMY